MQDIREIGLSNDKNVRSMNYIVNDSKKQNALLKYKELLEKIPSMSGVYFFFMFIEKIIKEIDQYYSIKINLFREY